MEFLILGPLEVADDGRKLALGGPKQRAVLAHLILRANHVVPADLLIDGLWGEEPPESARNTLQTYVYRLRKLLGDERIQGRDGGYVLAAAPGEIDAERFESLAKQGKAQVAFAPAAAAAMLSDALSLWRADALADVTEEPSLRGEAARLEELRLSATEHRVAAEIAMGGHSTVVPELESLTARYPLRERMWANLMLALYRSGRQAEALSTFERARQVLGDELGADPSPELQRLHEQILRQDPELLESPRSPGSTPRSGAGDLPTGTEFAGYRIESVLGRGGMSVVYLAEHLGLERRVALKVLAPHLAEDERFRERFVRESRIAAGMEHPNIVPIYEAGEAAGLLFIAMRYVPGTDLGRLIRRAGTLDLERAARIVRDVASALDAAHARGLVHRDVKPGNVLVVAGEGSEGHDLVYLSDFGLTKRLEGVSGGLTQTGQFVGTVDYVAPEQIEGKRVDARADVYSLACVLFECLTGSSPYGRDSQVATLYAHLGEEPPRLTSSRPDLPHALDGVIARGLSKRAVSRYPTCGSLATAVRDAVGRPAGTDGIVLSRWTRWRVPIGASLAAALVAGLVVFSIARSETPSADGAGGSPPSDVSPSPTPQPNFRTVARELTGDEERLLTSIPTGPGSECLPLDRDEPLRGELAALVCRTGDVEVLYELFPSRGAMDDEFQINVNNTQADEGECATDHFAVSVYTIGGEPAGRVLCYTRSVNATQNISSGVKTETSHIEWTDEDSAIYAHAVRNDFGDLTLYEWWLSSAGPLTSGESGPAPAKDRPATLSGPLLRDGSYLAAPPGGCIDLVSTTCALTLDTDTYEIVSVADGSAFETGSILLRKPHAVIFAPRTGHCFLEGLSTRPAVFEWTASDDRLSFDRTSGGGCAGPQGLTPDPWTRAPDGIIAFETDDEIVLTDAGGLGPQRLTADTSTDPNFSPDWSGDGSMIVFAGAGSDYDLYVMNADGTGVSRLTDETGDELQPAWSPDGHRIAFAFDDLGGGTEFRSGVVVVNTDGTAWTELAMLDSKSVYQPVWSPDGDQIAFSAFDQGGHELYVMDADGTDLAAVHEESRDVIRAPMAWTPDGRRIVFWGEGPQGETLMSMRPDGTDVRVFVGELPQGDGGLSLDWSPDGRWVVIAGLREVRFQTGSSSGVYLMRADGSMLFTISSLGSEATWRPEAE